MENKVHCHRIPGKVSAPTFLGKKGLIRKYYLNGDEGGGGVYLWESKEAAEA